MPNVKPRIGIFPNGPDSEHVLWLSTAAEKELKKRPIKNFRWLGLSEKQLVRREQIAAKIFNFNAVFDKHLGAEHRQLYENWPSNGFYQVREQDREDCAVILFRAFGVRLADGTNPPVLHAFGLGAKAEPRITSIPVTKVERVTRWSQEQQDLIRRNGVFAGVFEDPLGFITARDLYMKRKQLKYSEISAAA
jgi:hypothetical protein